MSTSGTYYPLTEQRVVKELICNRWRIDSSYQMKIYETSNPTVSNGVPPFNEDIICTYIDLDRAIENCGLTDIQRLVIEQTMRGYDPTDIGNHCFKTAVTRQTVHGHINAAVARISAYCYDRGIEFLSNRKQG